MQRKSTFLGSLSEEARESVFRNLSKVPAPSQWIESMSSADAMTSIDSSSVLADVALACFTNIGCKTSDSLAADDPNALLVPGKSELP